MPHFLASDLLGLSLGLLLGVPLILLPGYAFGWWLDLLRFRSHAAETRWALAVVLGLGIMPIVIYLPFKLLSVPAMWGCLSLIWVAGVAAVARRGAVPTWSEISRAAKIAVATWTLLGAFLSLDVAAGEKLYPSASIIDQSFRSQVVASLAHSNQLPPVSYFYYPERPVHFRYHYLLFLVGANIERLGLGYVSPNIALVALSIWVGFGLIALVGVFVESFGNFENKSHAKRIAWILLAAGGLDVLPVGADILHRFLTHELTTIPYPDIEWWNGWGQVFSWIDTAIWQPHHLAALIGCLMGCLLLWDGRHLSDGQRWISSLGAGLLFASASGTSIYVTVVFVVFLLLVVLEVMLNVPRYAPPLLAAGILALLLTAPFLLELLGSPNGSPIALPFGIGIRPFRPFSATLLELGVKSLWTWNIGSLLMLPINYLLELGVFFIAGPWWLLRLREQESRNQFRDHLLIGLGAVSLVLATFVWSGTESSNDFGYRGILAAQFALLIFATHMVIYLGSNPRNARPSWLDRLVFSTIFIGILSNLVGAVLLRSISFSDAGVAYRINTLRGGSQAERLHDMRAAYDWLRKNSNEDAILQENPEFSFALMLGQYSDRRTAAYSATLIPSFVRSDDPARDSVGFNEVVIEVRSLFLAPADVDRALFVCAKTGIDYLVVQDCDPIWADRRSYVWTEAPVFAAPRVRVFSCSR